MATTIPDINNYPIDDDAKLVMNMMQRVLDTVVGVYEQMGVPLPARQFWTTGGAVEDCEQVTVNLIQAYLGNPGDQATQPQRCNVARSAVLNIAVTRNFPIGENGKAVSPDRIMQGSAWAMIDVQVLLEALRSFDQWSDGGPGLGVIATVSPADPSGGVQTVNMNLTMAIG